MCIRDRGIGFLWYAVRLFTSTDDFFPMKMFNYSIIYLMVLFAFLLADHWLVEPTVHLPVRFDPIV